MAITQSFNHTSRSPKPKTSHLRESGWARVGVQLLSGKLGGAVGQRELEVLGEELLDVGAADGVGLLDLNDLEDLRGYQYTRFRKKK